MGITLSTDLFYPLNWLCYTHSVEPHLVLALIQQESAFNPSAVGDNGQSFGLMQLHLQGAGYGYQPEDLLLIPINLRIGIQYLSDMIEVTGYVAGGLSAYNQGLAGFRRRGPEINAQYVAEILARYDSWKELTPILAEGQQECFRIT